MCEVYDHNRTDYRATERNQKTSPRASTSALSIFSTDKPLVNSSALARAQAMPKQHMIHGRRLLGINGGRGYVQWSAARMVKMA